MADVPTYSGTKRKKCVTVQDIINACWDENDDVSDISDDSSSDDDDFRSEFESDDIGVVPESDPIAAPTANSLDPCERDSVLVYDVSRICYYTIHLIV